MNYRQFLESKIHFDHAVGFEIDRGEINPVLQRHQPDIVQWMVRGGRRACFARFGLGKTPMNLEVSRLTLKYAGGGRALIPMPLGVRGEFRKDAANLLGWKTVPRFIRKDSEIDEEGIYFTNYEAVREGNVSFSNFRVIGLDEAAVLRSYGSKTYQELTEMARDVEFRYVYTATPSPNRYKEIIHYAGFLGIMDTGQALTRFFERDSTQANNLTLYPHKETEFWLWVSSWAVLIQKPSDLGYSDEGYELPELDIRYHEVPASYENAGEDRDGQKRMYRDAALGLKEAAQEKRESIGARVTKMREVMDEVLSTDPDAHCILWHDLEDERHAIRDAVPGVVEIYGTLDVDLREQRLMDFGDGKSQFMATKKSLSASGGNYQRHCHWAIFVGIDFDFNDFIQAIHRLHRFQQKHRVRVDLILTEAERGVLKALQEKWTRHNEMGERLAGIIREFGLNPIKAQQALARTIGLQRREQKGEGWLVANNDCVLETESMAENSVDFIVTSIPFANHYEYTPSYNDFGHTDDNRQFWQQMDYLTPQLLRVLKPGRICCIHVKDRIQFGAVTGAGVPTVSPFHAEALGHFSGIPALGIQGHGFDYLGMITIVTDVVRENNQTYRLSYGEMCKDSTKMGVGSPEYVLIFHKPQTDRTKGYADDRVTKDPNEYSLARWQVDAHAYWRSSGNRLLTPRELAMLPADSLPKAFREFSMRKVYDYEEHVAIGDALAEIEALPKKYMSLAPASHDPMVWDDVNRMFTLNAEQKWAGQEKHVCPIQYDIVDRLIRRFTNQRELVFDPFGGLFTIPFRALHLGREGRAAELNPRYFDDGVGYLRAKERELATPDLFAVLEMLP